MRTKFRNNCWVKRIINKMKIDKRDRGIGEIERGQQTEACFNMADIIIMNKESLEELEKKLAN